MLLQRPFATRLHLGTGQMSPYERYFSRRASDMKGYYRVDPDGSADPIIYECFEREVPAESGQVVQNITIVHPGTIHGEYYMTKGHYHANPQCAEVYLCLSGTGYLLMQTKGGEWDLKEFQPGMSVYAPPGWSHRSVNVGDEPLVLYALYPADSGHDYDAIVRQGFLKRVVCDEEGRPSIVPAQAFD
jgi:glucose-6-phosphate isomerase